MTRFLLAIFIFHSATSWVWSATPNASSSLVQTMNNPTLTKYIEQRVMEFEQIPPARKQSLEKLALHVQSDLSQSQSAQLTFICTHNSRRSHMAQLWSAAASQHYHIPHVSSFSGGTEQTAFNPRAVAALQRAGFQIVPKTTGDNPIYAVTLNDQAEPLQCFSKRYDAPPNPTKDFCAILVCSHADQHCPTVTGASLRLAIPYDDPKMADNTASEAQIYDERCAQIAREILYVFSQVQVESRLK